MLPVDRAALRHNADRYNSVDLKKIFKFLWALALITNSLGPRNIESSEPLTTSHFSRLLSVGSTSFRWFGATKGG
jgi:hypothetical protein